MAGFKFNFIYMKLLKMTANVVIERPEDER